MEPNRVGGPNFELPAQPAAPENQQGEHQAETVPTRPETAKQPPQATPLPPALDDIPVADQPIIAVPAQDVVQPVSSDSHSGAADTDRIEPEWVDKVKTVIAKTQDDPHLQKEQVSRIKAEYIQKRFNKTIKTDEAAA